MKIYFAGMETSYGYNYVDFLPTDNVFCTYFYKRNTEKYLLDHNISNRTGIITIDSGAHSFFSFIGLSVSADKTLSKGEMPDPEEYFINYVTWIKQWYSYADYFVELDLQDIVGQKRVEEWRDIYKKEGIYDKIITVHHSMNTDEDWDKMIRESESRYIALEGLRGGKVNLPYMKLIKSCYDNKVKVHGFALTNQSIIAKYPFYSVDSSSWTAVNRYGIIYKFDNGRMKQYKTCEKHFLENNIDMRLMSNNREKSDQHFKLQEAQKEFRKMEDFSYDLRKKRGVDWEKQLS